MTTGNPRIMGLNMEALALPSDLMSRIREGYDLVEAELPGAETLKCYVRGRPDLLARLMEGEGPSFDTLAQSLGALSVLHHDYDVPVPPFVLMERDSGDIPPDRLIITAFVDGTTLGEALANDADGDVAPQTDQLLASLSRGLVGQRYSSLSDIYGSDQYMVGTILEESRQRLLLVDFPSSLNSDDRGLAISTVHLADFILETEAASGRRMLQGRRAFNEALAHIPGSHGSDVPNVAAEIQMALETGARSDLTMAVNALLPVH